MARKINLGKMLEEIREDERASVGSPKRWASQDDIKKMLKEKKTKKNKGKG